MKLKKRLLIIVILLVNIQLFAQDEYSVSGTVVDENNIPIPGVNVIVLNTTRGLQTDFDGNYSISVSDGEILQYTYIGYVTQTVVIAGQEKVNITLIEDVAQLDEVVVVGYGNQKQKNLTSALTKVDGSDLQKASVARVEDALQGRVAGLRIQVTSSEAGGDPRITLRGPGSITGSSSPLVVVDGVVLGNDPDILSSIDNNNIENISVLKDASSVAIYGSRGASGVILVTLKEGVAGDTKYTYNTFTGYKFATDNENFTFSVAEERARLDGLQSTVDAIEPGSNRDNIINRYDQAYAELAAFDAIIALGDGELDLQDEIFPGGFITSHSFSLRGGTELTKYSASVSYLEDEGIAIADNFRKFNASLKIDSKSKSKKVRYGLNLRTSFNDQDRLPTRFTNALRQYGYTPTTFNQNHIDVINQGIENRGGFPNTQVGNQFVNNLFVGGYGFSRAFEGLYVVDPNNRRDILRDANGNPVINGSDEALALGVGQDQGLLTLGTTSNVGPLVPYIERQSTRERFSLNATAYVDFKLAKGLNFKQTISGTYRNTNANRNDGFFSQRANETSRQVRRDELQQYVVESVLRYKRSFGKHNLNPVLGFEFTNRDFFRQQSDIANFSNDANSNIALSDLGTTFTLLGTDKLVSYFGRINYDYDERFLVQISARTDGSTRFGADRRFGFFPAASVGWNISNEEFFPSDGIVSFLKLRASYGASGSNEISNNVFDSLFRFEETFASVSANGETGVKSIARENSDLGWERLIEFNPGLDVTFGRGVLSFSADYYTRISDDLILSTPVPGVTGVDTFLQNIGEVKNEGFELELSARLVSNEDFRWSASGQFALNRNTVLDLGGADQIISRIDDDSRPTEFIARVGQPITSFFGYVFESEIPLENINNPFNRFNNDFGRVFVKDLNGDGIIDADDRTELGSPYPDFTFGLGNDFTYRNLDMSFQIQGSIGGEVRVADLDQLLFASEGAVQTNSLPEDLANRTILRRDTSAHIQDASFGVLRNITFGYSFPESFTSKYDIDKLRLYVTGDNLFYVTAKDYQGFNPEAAGQTSSNANTPLTAGYQRGDGPVVRTISAGINFQF